MPNGVTIHPDQVLGSPRAGSVSSFSNLSRLLKLGFSSTVFYSDIQFYSSKIFFIIDIPSLDYLPALLASPAFEPYQSGSPDMTPKCIVHLLGAGVLEDTSYREWMCRFGNTTHHIVAAADYSPQQVIFERHAVVQLKLNKLDEDIFPMVWYKNQPRLELGAGNDYE